ncbi:hypothetical protein [Sulfitobacter sp. SK012]|uniref:hypothetical protein n=1 Tax=Sulfitobacter sp. SK012 TaxID=1389005 RepID=UPI001C1FA89F|nr:hypothetical protein [Sulfitobacter sp. SK012]
MGRTGPNKGKGGSDQYTPLPYPLLKSKAWRSLSGAAVKVFFELHSRTYLAQMDALKKYRAKAQQTVRVERVSVHEGGQAIVGDVNHGGRVEHEK